MTWTYAILALPILLLPTALARREDAALRVATYLVVARRHPRHRDPRFPVWDLGGLLGSYLWAVWLIAIGVLLLRRPASGATRSVTADLRN